MAKKQYNKPLEVASIGNDLEGFFWELLLYPDEDPEHKQVFDIFTKNLFCNIRWIVHDKDFHHEKRDEQGNLIYYDKQPKKPHVHMLWKTESRIKIDQVSALSHLPTHYISRVNSIAVRSQYLLHRDVQSLFDDYQYKYQDYELDGALPLIPNKWDEDYLFSFWGSFIRKTQLSWGDVVYHIGCAGHFKWLNKYRNLLKDIYFSSHVGNECVYKSPYLNNQEKEKEKCTLTKITQLEQLHLREKMGENGLL